MAASVSNTVYGIISDAMHDAGLLGLGDEPNSEQLATNMRRLCDLINVWQTQGLKLFLLQDISITLTAGKSKYSLGTGGDVDMVKPSRVLDGYILNTSNVRRPIVSLSWEEWMRLSQVTGNDSAISSYFVDKQASFLYVNFWNTPNAAEAANTAHLLVQVAANNPNNLEASSMFPQEWRMALRWGLADDICTGQPQAIMDRCAGKARAFRDALEDWDVEDTSTSFAVDARMYNTTGKFR